MEPIRVIIADDSDFVRDGMKIILDIDADFESRQGHDIDYFR